LKELKASMSLKGRISGTRPKRIHHLENQMGRNASKIFIKINELRMIKFGSLVKHEFRPGFNVIIIAIGNIKVGKNSWLGGMISTIFFRNNFVKINTVEG
jgi:hypothetical protein